MAEIAFEVGEGLSFKDLQQQRDAIASICGCPVELVNQVGAVKIRLFTETQPSFIDADKEAPFDRKKGFLMGIDPSGQSIYFNFQHPHALIAGETGWGKTVWLILFLAQVVELYTPQEAQILLIDLKGTDFIFLEHVPHMMGPIRSDLPSAALALRDAVRIMHQRQKAIQEAKRRRQAPPHFPKLYLIVDEAANIAPSQQGGDKDAKEIAQTCDSCLSELARIGRSLSIHILYCTQYPRFDVVNPQIRINAGARLCFYVPVPVASEVVLDRPDASELTCKGRAIFRSKGKFTTIQVPYANEDYWIKRIDKLYPWEANFDDGEAETTDSESPVDSSDPLHGSGGDLLPLVPLPTKTGE